MDLDEFLVENGIPLDPVNDSLDSNDKNTASDVSLDSFVQSPEQLNFKGLYLSYFIQQVFTFCEQQHH